jgi:magnesium chelatase family protein
MRITVNLSPAGMRKEGTAFDLPIAVGILKALGHLPGDSTDTVTAFSSFPSPRSITLAVL